MDSTVAPVALFVGDSYTSGWGLEEERLHLRWTSVASRALGWSERNAGCPGSGYVSSGPVCRAPYRVTAGRHVQPEPAVVVLSGGINDCFAGGERAAKEAARTVRRIAELFPDARRLVATAVAVEGLGAGTDVHGATTLAALNAALASACDAHGATLLDLGEPLAHRSDLLGSDRLHPTVEGHAMLARTFLDALAAAESGT